MASQSQAFSDSDSPRPVTTEVSEASSTRGFIRPVFVLNDDSDPSSIELLALLQCRVDMIVSMQLDIAGEDLVINPELSPLDVFRRLCRRVGDINTKREAVKSANPKDIQKANDNPDTSGTMNLSELASDASRDIPSMFLSQESPVSDLAVPLSLNDLRFLIGRLDLYIHDIGTPLTSLNALLQMIERRVNKAVTSGDAQALSVDFSLLFDKCFPLLRRDYDVINMLLLYLGIERGTLVTDEALVEYYGGSDASNRFVKIYPLIATTLRLNLEQNLRRYVGSNEVDMEDAEYCDIREIELGGKRYYLLVAMDNGEGYPPEIVAASSFIKGRVDARSSDSTGEGMYGVQQSIKREGGAWRIANDLLVIALNRETEPEKLYPKFDSGELVTLPDDLLVEYARKGYRGACLMVLLPVIE